MRQQERTTLWVLQRRVPGGGVLDCLLRASLMTGKHDQLLRNMFLCDVLFVAQSHRVYVCVSL